MKGWHGTTLGKIVGEVAKNLDLNPACAASLAVPYKAQSREGDLAFLRRLGRERHGVAKTAKGALILKPIGTGILPAARRCQP